MTSRRERDDHVDEVVQIASIKHLDQGIRISPQLPILFMIDIIYGYFLSDNKLKKIRNI